MEAYRTGVVRTLLHQLGDQTRAAVQAISDLRAAVDGGTLDDQGVVVGGKANLVPADDNGLTYSRTTRQVLNIVYLRKNAMSGGFFPAGLNGAIK